MNDSVVTSQSISTATAHTMVKLAVEEAEKLGVLINVSVVDSGGNPLAFIRMNGAPLHSISIAEDKAYTSVSFGIQTSKWMDLIGDIPQLREGLVVRDRFVIFGGGVPITVNEQVVGAIGVSGASEEQDELCAMAGLAALG